jgi:hypothetical protein
VEVDVDVDVGALVNLLNRFNNASVLGGLVEVGTVELDDGNDVIGVVVPDGFTCTDGVFKFIVLYRFTISCAADTELNGTVDDEVELEVDDDCGRKLVGINTAGVANAPKLVDGGMVVLLLIFPFVLILFDVLIDFTCILFVFVFVFVIVFIFVFACFFKPNLAEISEKNEL